uniref:Uncharacterized protein n=1 Tax=Arundo donax TaxID=35708 RepID=A0A0A9HEC0_ARUDO
MRSTRSRRAQQPKPCPRRTATGARAESRTAKRGAPQVKSHQRSMRETCARIRAAGYSTTQTADRQGRDAM